MSDKSKESDPDTQNDMKVIQQQDELDVESDTNLANEIAEAVNSNIVDDIIMGSREQAIRIKEKRNLVISILYVLLIIFVIIMWIYTTIVNEEYHYYINWTQSNMSHDTNQTIYMFPYQYTWFISIPLAFFLMLFPAHAFISGIFNMICPIRFMKVNSEYYSCIPPVIPENFKYPSVTIHLPVYKEDFKVVITPTLNSVIACREYYEGVININILVSDDGIASLNTSQVEERKLFYENNNIGYIARPVKNRAGKFKKASNLNFSMEVCRINEIYPDNNIEQSMKRINCEISCGGDPHIGDYILLVDSDSRIPLDCLKYVLVEMENDPKLALTQHITYPIKQTFQTHSKRKTNTSIN